MADINAHDPGTRWPEGAKQAGFILAAAWGVSLFGLAMLAFYAAGKDQHAAPPSPETLRETPQAIWLDVPAAAEQKIDEQNTDIVPESVSESAPQQAPEIVPQTPPEAAPQQAVTPAAEKIAAKPEPNPEPKPEPVPAPVVEPKPEPVVLAKPEPQPAPVAEPEPQPEPVVEPQAEAEPKSEPESAPVQPAQNIIMAEEASAPMEAQPEEAGPSAADQPDQTAAPQSVGKVFLVLLGGGDNTEILETAPAGTAIVLTNLGDRTAGFVAEAAANSVRVLLPLVFGEEALEGAAPLPSLAADPLTNRSRLAALLDDLPEMDGLYLVPGHPFFQKPESLRMMLAEIAQRGMAVVGFLPEDMRSRFPNMAYVPLDGGLTPAPADDLAAQMGALSTAKGKGQPLNITAPSDPDLLQTLQGLAEQGRAEFYLPNGL